MEDFAGHIIPLHSDDGNCGFHPYVLEPGGEKLEEYVSLPCLVLVTLKREHGLLIALPSDAVDEELCSQAQHADPLDLLGPSKQIEVAGAAMDFAFPYADPMEVDIKVKVLLMDFSMEAVPSLKSVDEYDMVEVKGFGEDVGIIPRANELLEEVDRMVSNAVDPRISYYSAEEEMEPELPPEEEQQGPRRPKAAKPRARPSKRWWYYQRRICRAPKEETHGRVIGRVLGAGDSSPSWDHAEVGGSLNESCKHGGHFSLKSIVCLEETLRQLSYGSSKASAPLGSFVQQMSPPRSIAPRVVVSSVPKYIKEDTAELAMDKEEQEADSPDLAKAMLLQSKALTALVGQLAGSTADPIHDLASSSSVSSRGAAGRAKLQMELASQKGIFYRSVMTSMARRMQPSMPPGRPLMELHARGVCATPYLERFGGYGKVKEYGHLAWHVALVMDHIQAESWEAVQDSVALLTVCLEQFALDQGRTDLGLLMTLAEELAESVFTNRSLAQGARQVAFAEATHQAAQPKNPPPSAAAPKGNAKKKGKGGGKRQKEEEETVE